MDEIKPIVRDLAFWQDRIAKSNGTSVLMPEKLATEIKEILELEEKGRALSNELAKLNVEGEARMAGVWFNFRKFLSENGSPSNWLDEIGLDQNALDDGFFIVNITKKNKK